MVRHAHGSQNRARHVPDRMVGQGSSRLLADTLIGLPTITAGRPALLVTLTLPEHLQAGRVDFARQLAAKAWAYAVAVERRYRGLPPLPDTPVPCTPTAKADAWRTSLPGTDAGHPL
jgi:hypothetical protein